jgi:redox-regulated HSP33 family molecular chaperone
VVLPLEGSSVSILYGKGDGTFKSPVTPANSYADVGPNAVAVADMNGDGHADLIIGNGGYFGEPETVTLSVMLSKGDGTFADPVDYPLNNVPEGLAIADLNGDGKLDVISTGFFQNTDVLLGTGGGVLGTSTNYSTGSTASTIAVGDFNGDGIVDFAVVDDDEDFGIGDIDIMPGKGDGTFGGFIAVASTSGIGSFVVGDFNGDGLPSFVASTDDAGVSASLGVSFYTAQITGVLVTSPESAQSTYNPGTADPYTSATSKVVNLSPATFGLNFSTPPATALTAGQPIGTLAVTVLVDGSAYTAQSATVQLVVTGPNGYFQTYSQATVNGIASFTSLPPLTAAGTYIFNDGTSSVPISYNDPRTVTVTAGVTTASALAVAKRFATPANPGVAAPWTISAVDSNTNAVATFTGTVTVSSSDPAATFTPVSHTFTAADAGTYTFQIALNTGGTQSLTASSAGLTSVTQSGILVSTALVATKLVVTPGTPVTAMTTETLTATVTNGSAPQYPGTVAFSDSTRVPALIGTAQLNSSGVAVFHTVLPVGSHPLTATFTGTTTVPAAASTPQTFVITGTQSFLTSGLFNATQSPGFINLEDVAGFFGQPKPTGQINFVDSASGNVLTSVTPAGPYYSFVINTNDTRVGTPGYALAAGDLNGDGVLDLVAANSATTDNTVTVYLGNGGTFTQTQVYAVGTTPTGVALADFNNDGLLDIIVTNTGDNTASVLLGKGDGTFGLPLTVSTGTAPTSVTVADIDRDGNLDALVTNSGTTTVSILYGKGDGTFKSQTPLTVASGPNGIAIADFNEDGIPDLAVTSLNTNSFMMLPGKADGTFGPGVTIATNAPTSAIIAADFGNGHQDIAVSIPSIGLVSEFEGQGNGTFVLESGVQGGSGQSQPNSLAVGDFNQDGFLDLAVGYASASGSGVVTTLGAKGGMLGGVQLQTGFGQTVLGLVAGDFQNTGLPELVATNTTIPSQYNGDQKETAISLLQDAQTYDMKVTPFNIPDALDHFVYAQYVPGPNDAFSTSYSNFREISGALRQSAFFSPTLLATTTAGVLPGSVNAEIEADGEAQSSYNGPVQVTVVGLTLPYSQTYTINATNGFANFSGTVVAPTQEGVYRYLIAVPNSTASYASDQITVTPAATSQLVISNKYITPTVTGIAGVIGVSAEDKYGNPNPAFGGTVTLTSTDPAAVISPASHTYASQDIGYTPFTVTFKTVGTQSLTATTTGLTTNTATQTNIVVKTPAVATTTTIALSATGTVAAETLLTLTATVKDSSSNPVTQGIVDFFDTASTPHLIATAEVKTSGTATATAILPVGTHALTATLETKNAYATSTSPVANLTVTPAANYITETVLTASGSAAGYTLSGNLLALGRPAPTGTTLTFQDTSNGNASLGSATLGASTYGLAPQVTYPTGSVPTSVSVADFNGDGKLDLVVTNEEDATVTVQLGKGDGTFGAQSVIFTYSIGDTLQVLAGDFNGDGKADFALLNQDGSVYMALGNGDGTFATPTQAQAPPDGTAFNFNAVPYYMVAGDFNRDGRLDLAVMDSLDSTVLVMLGFGDGTFQKAVPYASETTPQGLAVADINGDGKLDLIVTNSVGNTVSTLLGNGDGTFQQQVTSPTGKTPAAVIATDLNGDGAPDLAVLNTGDKTVSVLLNNGNGTFAAQKPYAVGTGPLNLVAIDLNADGKVDLAVTNEFDNTVSLLNGIGDGTFAPQAIVPTGIGPDGIAFGDFNGAGLNSLAVTNSGDNTVSILLGVQNLVATISNVALSGSTVHNVDAIYTSGTADPYASSTSNIVALQGSGLGPAATTTTVTSDFNPGYASFPVDFTATVASPIGVLATGSLSFYDGATLLGTMPLSAKRSATLTSSSLTAGNHNITAVYTGDTNFATSTSPVLIEVVQSLGSDFTSLNLTSSLNPAPAGTNVVLTAIVSPSTTLSVPPTGSVTFFEGTTSLGVSKVGTSGAATLTISTLAAGKHILYAAYTGDTSYSGSQSSVISQVITGGTSPSTTTLGSTASTITAGQTVKFTATVSSSASGTPSGTVTFSDNGTTIGTGPVSSGTATFSTSTLTAGSHPITATYSGDGNFAGSTSSPLSITVNASPTSTTTLTPSASSLTEGLSLKLTAAITSSIAGTPTGSVNFLDGATSLGTGTVSGGTTNISTSTLAPGVHSLTAVYAGDSTFPASTSAAVSVTINKGATTTVLTSSAGTVSAGQSVTFTATVSTTDAGTPSGSINFLDGSTTLGGGTLGAGHTATYTTSVLTAATHTITAVYAGDNIFTGSTAAAITETVTGTNPVPTLTSLQPTGVTAGSAAFTLTVNGTGFISGSVVNFNGTGRVTTFVSATQVTAAILASDVTSVGTPSVTVTNPTPGGGASNALTFTVAAANNPAPTITSLSPTSVTAGSAAFTLTVNGTGFISGSVVNFNGTGRVTTFVSATQVTAAILASDITTAGTRTVTVTNSAPGGGTSGSLTFTVNNPAPTITTLAPTGATAGSAALTLTVNGTNFVSGSVVNFNGTARVTTFVSATQLTAAILASDITTVGTPPVTVTTAAPGGGTSTAVNFAITAANNPVPAITSLSPSTATAGSAALTLTVNGTGFVSGSVVNFNGSARVTTFVSATQVTAAILASDVASVGTPAVTVTNPPPGGGTSGSLTFTVNNPVPTITALLPASAISGSAAFTLTVNGTGFLSSSVVNFNSSARVTTFVSATQLTAAILASDIATIGTPSVTVANPAPGGGTSTAVSFSIVAPPVPTFAVTSPTTVQTVHAGGIAQYTITVAAQNGTFSNPVTLTASGLPSGATATFVPATITPGSTSATSVLSIQTALTSAKVTGRGSGWPLAATALPLFGLLFASRKRRLRWITLAVLLFASLGAVTALTGCGGGYELPNTSKSFNITVTGTSGAVLQTTTVQLTVQ